MLQCISCIVFLFLFRIKHQKYFGGKHLNTSKISVKHCANFIEVVQQLVQKHMRATQAIICPSLMKWSQKSYSYKFLLLLFGTYTGYQLNSYFNIVRICISLTGCQCCEQGSVDTGHTAEQRWLNWRYWGCTWKMTSNNITKKKNTNTPFFLFTKH